MRILWNPDSLHNLKNLITEWFVLKKKDFSEPSFVTIGMVNYSDEYGSYIIRRYTSLYFYGLCNRV